MCGIAGIIDRRAPVSVDLLATLGARLAHRGPDGQRTLLSQDRRVGLVHARLAIIDTQSRSDQPFVSADGRFAITAPGRERHASEVLKKPA